MVVGEKNVLPRAEFHKKMNVFNPGKNYCNKTKFMDGRPGSDTIKHLSR